MPMSLAAARAQFPHASGYLDAATLGLPPNEAVRALRADLVAWGTANRDPAFYGGVVESARGHYARIVGTEVDDVAIGSQTSVRGPLPRDMFLGVRCRLSGRPTPWPAPSVT